MEKLRMMRTEWEEYRKAICTDKDLPASVLASVDACYRISILEHGKKERAFETCRRTIFGGRRTRNEIRRLLCNNEEMATWYQKCINDIHRKNMVMIPADSIEDLLEKVWPLYLERQICLKEALGIQSHDGTNGLDNSGKEKD